MLKANNALRSLGIVAAVAAIAATAACKVSPTPAGTVGAAAQPTANGGTAAHSTSSDNPSSGNQVSNHEPFDGDRAMAILKKQCEFGVRPLGTPAHAKTREYLIAQMKLYADEVKLQEFKYRDMPVTNVIGVFYPAGSDKPAELPLLLLTHWDTRPIADGPYSAQTRSGVKFRYGPGGWKPLAPIMGANDAASGVAVLLELARILKAKRAPVGIVMLLDDGEDYGDFTANNREGDGVELGARYFAKHFAEEKSFGRPYNGVLLDMVGAKNAFFVPEELSQNSAPDLNELIFRLGSSLGYGDIFRTNTRQGVGDDHVWINQAGIPTIDLIHPLPYGEFEMTGYTHWHTQEDTVDKCSPATLKAVGDTLAEMIYRSAPTR